MIGWSNATATANLDTFGFGDVAIGGDVTITASGSNAAYVNADNIRTTGFDDDVFVSAVGSWAEVNVGDIQTIGSGADVTITAGSGGIQVGEHCDYCNRLRCAAGRRRNIDDRKRRGYNNRPNHNQRIGR